MRTKKSVVIITIIKIMIVSKIIKKNTCVRSPLSVPRRRYAVVALPRPTGHRPRSSGPSGSSSVHHSPPAACWSVDNRLTGRHCTEFVHYMRMRNFALITIPLGNGPEMGVWKPLKCLTRRG